jgi:hypothetical protein
MRHSEFGTSLDHHLKERKIYGDSLNHWLLQLSASSHVEKERIKMLVLAQQKSAGGPYIYLWRKHVTAYTTTVLVA